MLSILAASGGQTTSDHAPLGSHAASLCVHATVLACVVAVSGPRRQPDGIRILPDAQPVWNVPDRAAPASPRPNAASLPAVGAFGPVLTIPAIPTAEIPELPGATVENPGWAPGGDWRPAVDAGPAPAPAGPVAVDVVEEAPVLLRFPAPRYPEILRQAGIEGRAVVEVVLDTLGRAEPTSVRVLSSTHRLFEAAAVQVVLGSTYSPGRVAGRAVRVRIQVPVLFALRRR